MTFTKNFGIGTGGLYTGPNGTTSTVNPILTSCVFTSNTATLTGGATFFDASANSVSTAKVTITGSIFRDNIARGDGKGRAILFSMTNSPVGSLSINNSLFEDNTGNDAEAIFADYGTFTLTNSEFRRNKAIGSNSGPGDGGGAMFQNKNAAGTIEKCLFNGNSTPNYNGGGFAYAGSPDQSNQNNQLHLRQ